ncbi:MAG: DUF4886 domain-containing protein [Muribaculaceae bacterium]|nr:DUF4886 domain-containing protein [Muribaculaceae bacterium]
MAPYKTILAVIYAVLMAMTSCGNDEEPYCPAASIDSSIYKDHPLRLRHRGSCLKILCIGNSFTINATTYMPWLVDHLNGDSICVARLTRSGCSLKEHWTSHADDSEDYDFYYSDSGKWAEADIKTIDVALAILDWDIITIQQVSGYSGLYSTYQPYLDNLTRLFRETNPAAQLAWHYTWAYTPWTKHSHFKNYGSDSEKMYDAIMAAGDKASEGFDIRILSAPLIKRMREEFPEVENGFSDDGYHIVDPFALYALSALWYDTLIRPACGTCRPPAGALPPGVKEEGLDKVEAIIRSILGDGASEDPDLVDMIGE